MFDSAAVQAREVVVEIRQAGIGMVRKLGAPLKFARTPADPSGVAPALGEHTRQILLEAGLETEPA